jgi:NitT/TauT family transport system substrate-binding protein
MAGEPIKVGLHFSRRDIIRLAFAATGGVALGGVLAACANGDGDGNGAAPTPTATSGNGNGNGAVDMRDFSSAIVPVTNFAGLFRLQAISQERFGFELEFTQFASGTESTEALAAGRVDIAPTGVTQPIILVTQGAPVKIVADTSRLGKGLMVGEGINSFEDLLGQDIGSVGGSGPDIFLRKKLTEEGIDPDADVTLVNVPYLEMPAAVEQGLVAGASGNEPWISVHRQNGGTVLSFLDDTELGDIDGVFSFNQSLLDDRELAKAFLAAYAEAQDELNDDPDLVVETMEPHLDIDEEILRMSLENLRFTTVPDRDALENLATVMQELGQIETVPAVDDFLDISLIEEVT